MSSTVVQVKSNVSDPDFPSLQLDNVFLKYVESFDSDRVLFKFIDNNPEYVKLCKSHGLNPELICLSRSEVLWHKKDWNTPTATPDLSCYYAVKRNRN